MTKSGRTARSAVSEPKGFVRLMDQSDANVERFIATVKSLGLPKVRIPQGTGRAQFMMLDGLVAVTQTREDYAEWPFVAKQDGHTFPTLWKLWFVPISDIEVGSP